MKAAYDYILLDFNGTLATSTPNSEKPKKEWIKQFIEAAYTKLNHTIPHPSAIEAELKKSGCIEKVLHNLAPEITQDELESLVEAYAVEERQSVVYRTELIPGIFEVVKTLHEAGITMIVVSFQSVAPIQAVLERAGIAPYITKIIATQAKDLRKPNRAIFDQLIEPFFSDIRPERTMVLGDETADILFARNIGATASWAYYGGGDFDKCRLLKPDYTIYEPQYLLDIVLK